MKSIFLSNQPANIKNVFSADTIKLLTKKAGLTERIFTGDDLAENKEAFGEVEYIFSTWGMPILSEEEIKEYFPSLKCVFYAAGSVQSFAKPFLSCGVKVFSASSANAVPVAEYTVAQIILASKGFFAISNIKNIKEHKKAYKKSKTFRGNFGEKVGIIGAGMIGSLVIEMLKAYNLKVMVFDPFLSDERAKALGVEKCDLETLFKECYVVSNHLANNEQTKGMLNYSFFSEMRENSTFLNTGRGAQVVEADLVKVLTNRPDITAVLDVTDPEPPVRGHKFYKLQNCILTPHIAGSNGDEVCRMSEYMVKAFFEYCEGVPCKYEVTKEMLKTMA